MGPKKRGARKRKNEKAVEEEDEREKTEERTERRRKDHGKRKYIGAHVGIQGKTSLVKVSLKSNAHSQFLYCLFYIQVEYGKQWRLVQR